MSATTKHTTGTTYRPVTLHKQYHHGDKHIDVVGSLILSPKELVFETDDKAFSYGWRWNQIEKFTPNKPEQRKDLLRVDLKDGDKPSFPTIEFQNREELRAAVSDIREHLHQELEDSRLDKRRPDPPPSTGHDHPSSTNLLVSSTSPKKGSATRSKEHHHQEPPTPTSPRNTSSTDLPVSPTSPKKGSVTTNKEHLQQEAATPTVVSPTSPKKRSSKNRKEHHHQEPPTPTSPRNTSSTDLPVSPTSPKKGSVTSSKGHLQQDAATPTLVSPTSPKRRSSKNKKEHHHQEPPTHTSPRNTSSTELPVSPTSPKKGSITTSKEHLQQEAATPTVVSPTSPKRRSSKNRKEHHHQEPPTHTSPRNTSSTELPVSPTSSEKRCLSISKEQLRDPASITSPGNPQKSGPEKISPGTSKQFHQEPSKLTGPPSQKNNNRSDFPSKSPPVSPSMPSKAQAPGEEDTEVYTMVAESENGEACHGRLSTQITKEAGSKQPAELLPSVPSPRILATGGKKGKGKLKKDAKRGLSRGSEVRDSTMPNVGHSTTTKRGLRRGAAVKNPNPLPNAAAHPRVLTSEKTARRRQKLDNNRGQVGSTPTDHPRILTSEKTAKRREKLDINRGLGGSTPVEAPLVVAPSNRTEIFIVQDENQGPGAHYEYDDKDPTQESEMDFPPQEIVRHEDRDDMDREPSQQQSPSASGHAVASALTPSESESWSDSDGSADEERDGDDLEEGGDSTEEPYDILIPMATLVPDSGDDNVPLEAAAAIAEEAEAIKRDRIRLGLCPDCGVQLFDVKKQGFLGLKKVYMPLSEEGVSLKGRCLRCHPQLMVGDTEDEKDDPPRVEYLCNVYSKWTIGIILLLFAIVIAVSVALSLSGGEREPLPVYPPEPPGVPTWVQVGSDIMAPESASLFGSFLSLAEPGGVSEVTAAERLLVSAPGSQFSRGKSGDVYVYDLTDQGTQAGKMAHIPGLEAGNRARGVISKSGTRLAVGEPGHNDGQGVVRVFELGLGTKVSWALIGDPIYGDGGTGGSLALSKTGSIIAVGSQESRLTSYIGSMSLRQKTSSSGKGGTVRVYQYDEGGLSWVQLGNDIYCQSPSDDYRHRRTDTLVSSASWDKSGYSISLNSNGSILAIATDYNQGSKNFAQVRLYQYELTLGTWVQLGASIDGHFSWSGDHYGVTASLSASGHTVAVSAIGAYQGNRAGVFAYNETEQEWQQLGGSLPLDEELPVDLQDDEDPDTMVLDEGSFVGTMKGKNYKNAVDQVSLSDDGRRVAIASTRGGFAYVYEFKHRTEAWQQIGEKLMGEIQFGDSIALSSLGTRLAIGMSGEEEASVRLYSLQYILASNTTNTSSTNSSNYLPDSDEPTQEPTEELTRAPLTVPPSPASANFRANYRARFQHFVDVGCSGPSPAIELGCRGAMSTPSVSDPSIQCFPFSDVKNIWSGYKCTNTCAGSACEDLYLSDNLDDGAFGEINFHCDGETEVEVDAYLAYEDGLPGSCQNEGNNFHVAQLGVFCPSQEGDIFRLSFDDYYFECSFGAKKLNSRGRYTCYEGRFCKEGGCQVEFETLFINADSQRFHECIESLSGVPVSPEPPNDSLRGVSPPGDYSARFQAKWKLLIDLDVCQGGDSSKRITCLDEARISLVSTLSDNVNCTIIDDSTIECTDTGFSHINGFTGVVYECEGPVLPETSVDYPTSLASCQSVNETHYVGHLLQLGVVCQTEDGVEVHLSNDYFFECDEAASFDVLNGDYTCLSFAKFDTNSFNSVSVPPVRMETDYLWSRERVEECFQYSS